MTPGETLKRAAGFIARIHADGILGLEADGYPKDVIEGLTDLREALTMFGPVILKEKPESGMLAQWAREEAEERGHQRQAMQSAEACVPGMVAMVPPRYDHDEKTLFDAIINTLVSRQTWKREDMVTYAQDIVLARRAFFEPKG
jgi:hypothetical protein